MDERRVSEGNGSVMGFSQKSGHCLREAGFSGIIADVGAIIRSARDIVRAECRGWKGLS
jgi:hypothetical protein